MLGTYNKSQYNSINDFKNLDDFLRFFYTEKSGFVYSAQIDEHGAYRQNGINLERLDYNNLSESKFSDIVLNKAYNRYFTLNQFCYIKEDNGTCCLARQADNIKRLNAIYVDLDCYKLNMTKSQVLSALHNISDYGLPQYTMVVDSGRGIYVIWKLQNEDRNARSRWEKIESIFCERLESLGADPKATDCSRILRVPFSYNPKSNTMVRLIDYVDVSYTLNELCKEYLDYSASHKKNIIPYEKRKVSEKMRKCMNAISYNHNIPIDFDENSYVKVRAFLDEHCNLIKSVKVRYQITDEIPKYRTIQCSQNAEDICTLMKLRYGKEFGYREEALFLYRTMIMWATNDAEYALERTLELNTSFSLPLDEKTVIEATKSAEKYFKRYNYTRKTISRLLDITDEEADSLEYLSFAGDSRKHIRKKATNRTQENRTYYLRALKKKGKTTKKAKIDERRDNVLSLFNDGFNAEYICKELSISSSTLRRDMLALGITFKNRDVVETVVASDEVEVAEIVEITNNSMISFFKGCTIIESTLYRTQLSEQGEKIKNNSQLGGLYSVGVPPP